MSENKIARRDVLKVAAALPFVGVAAQAATVNPWDPKRWTYTLIGPPPFAEQATARFDATAKELGLEVHPDGRRAVIEDVLRVFERNKVFEQERRDHLERSVQRMPPERAKSFRETFPFRSEVEIQEDVLRLMGDFLQECKKISGKIDHHGWAF